MVKSTVIIVSKPPYGHENVYGALYAAVASQTVGLHVTLILIGDGVYSALKGQASDENIGYPSIENLFYMLYSDTKIYVEEASLTERKIPKENLLDIAKVISEDEIFKTICEAHAIITY